MKKIIAQNKKYILVWLVLVMVLFLRFYDGIITSYNTTILALNYSYGFLSRGFIGSLYLLVDMILPGSMYSYAMALKFSQLATVMLFLVMFIFVCFALTKASEEVKPSVYRMLIFFTIFAVPIFSARYNFGRVDLYLVIISLVAVMLLVSQRFEWLIVPLTAMGIMIHQGYAFMFYNVVLILLLYKIFTCQSGRKKYIAIMVSSLVICVVLFLNFELKHQWGMDVFNQVVSHAKAMGNNGDYHKDLISHEVLGIDLTSKEKYWHYMNLVQLPFFLAFFAPYIYLFVKYAKGVFRSCQNINEKFKYLLVAIGPMTMILNFILKVDYGRWIFAVLFYYVVVFIALNIMGDCKMVEQTSECKMQLESKPLIIVGLLMYAVFFQPLLDVGICNVVVDISEFLNNNFLHLWGGGIYVR